MSRIDNAHTLIGKKQAQALADLLWEGKLKGTSLPDVEPPARVAVSGYGVPERGHDMLASNRDGSHRVNDDGVIPMEEIPVTHTLVVMADDGRCWQIVRAGITWPM